MPITQEKILSYVTPFYGQEEEIAAQEKSVSSKKAMASIAKAKLRALEGQIRATRDTVHYYKKQGKDIPYTVQKRLSHLEQRYLITERTHKRFSSSASSQALGVKITKQNKRIRGTMALVENVLPSVAVRPVTEAVAQMNEERNVSSSLASRTLRVTKAAGKGLAKAIVGGFIGKGVSLAFNAIS
ncbi:MAG: hypothetical protein L7U87_08935 [Chlamydiales bacterium]|nr:hypothetical protein [Chlamydiales bacterium]